MSKDSDYSFSTPETVTATQVPDEERIHFLPDVFGDLLMLRGEFLVYASLERLCAAYTGGFYMAPDRSDPLRLAVAGNYFEGTLSADAAGIVATLFALCQLVGETRRERFIDAYHHLRAYADVHPEGQAIFAAID